MNFRVVVMLLVVFALTMSACASATPTASPTKPLTVEDQESLVKVLQAAGAKVESGDSITQEFFTPEGHTFKVNGGDLQVYEYPSADAMAQESSKVAPDGGSVGTSMMMWMDTPHFYKAGRIIVLYLGKDKALLDLLNKAMGPQFAGQ